MSLFLRSIKVQSFRKFREPVAIEGLKSGLNLIIEPNETGKSTLLEAIRAAFFVRHATKNQLAKSYAPHGESVGPEVSIQFETRTGPWELRKRFLKGDQIELRGPSGKWEGEAAENQLQELLGFARDTSQKGDSSFYGTLGLLWVVQAEALSVTAPGGLVRDTVRATLEAEVGQIMGGPAHNRVLRDVEAQFVQYWTPTGKETGLLATARDRVKVCSKESADAKSSLNSLEGTFEALETERGRLRILQRDIELDTDPEERNELCKELEVARAATQVLQTRKAEKDLVSGRVKAFIGMQDRYAAAVGAETKAVQVLESATEKRSSSAPEVGGAAERFAQAQSELQALRKERVDAAQAVKDGTEQHRRFRVQEAIKDAHRRSVLVSELESQCASARKVVQAAIPAKKLKVLEDRDRIIIELQAEFDAGTTQLEYRGNGAPPLSLNGSPWKDGLRTLTEETTIGLLEGAELIIRPPKGTASAKLNLAANREKQREQLLEHGLTSVADARERNEASREATADLRVLEARLETETPENAVIGLAAGQDALKAFLAGLKAEDAGDEVVAAMLPDLRVLQEALDAFDGELKRMEAKQDAALLALQQAENREKPLALAEAAAESLLENAKAQKRRIEEQPDFLNLDNLVEKGRKDESAAAFALEEAERHASAHDISLIERRIAAIDTRSKATLARKVELEKRIVELETTAVSEGGRGLAERAETAREEAEEASLQEKRVLLEAKTVRLLLETLNEARSETARTFVGPVAKRAKEHIERLLPGCDLTFTEDFGLEHVIRAGVREGCGHLSKGTQEQLAVLTRLAFADLLLEQGHPISLILDDPLVYSDDIRLDLMTDILSEASKRMQVILLTCRERAFRHLDAHRISLG